MCFLTTHFAKYVVYKPNLATTINNLNEICYDKRQIFLTAAALCLNMSISAQSVNLQNVTVKQALNKLQQTCGYSFVYEAKT